MNRILHMLALLAIIFASCKKDRTPKPTPVPPPARVFLKDVVIQNLPDPYYHFEYDASGKMTDVSFSSGEADYDLSYDNNRLSRMQNNHRVNKDRLDYQYDGLGRVSSIRIFSQAGIEHRRAFFDYDVNGRLRTVDWESKFAGPGFAQEQTLTFTYYGDGNLRELKDERFFIDGRQNASVYIDHFEGYDDKVNVDGFSLLHSFDQHLIILPGVQLQLNNPKKNIRTGTGTNYTIEYTYTYNAAKCPVFKKGDMLIQSGDNAGQRSELNHWFSYYE